MQARRAARELAFILFSQFDKKITNYSKDDLEDITKKLEKQKGMQEQIEELNHLAEEIETVEEVEINE